MKKITPNRRLNLINAISEYFEDHDNLNEWTHGFLENTQIHLQSGKDLTDKWYQKLLTFVRI